MVVKLVSDDAKDGEAVKSRKRHRIVVSESMDLWMKKEKPISVSLSLSLALSLSLCVSFLLPCSVCLSVSVYVFVVEN